MATWQSKLTKGQLAHLRGYGVRSLAQVKVNAEMQAKSRRDFPSPEHSEPCWDCKNIARALGLPTVAKSKILCDEPDNFSNADKIKDATVSMQQFGRALRNGKIGARDV